jgi:hypothetical protein
MPDAFFLREAVLTIMPPRRSPVTRGRTLKIDTPSRAATSSDEKDAEWFAFRKA